MLIKSQNFFLFCDSESKTTLDFTHGEVFGVRIDSSAHLRATPSPLETSTDRLARSLLSVEGLGLHFKFLKFSALMFKCLDENGTHPGIGYRYAALLLPLNHRK